MTSHELSLDGTGLRSGRPALVTLRRRPGAFALALQGEREVEVLRSQLEVVNAERATTVRVGSFTVATVEHLFAACAGLGLHEGFVVEVAGGEIPLLDGSALAFVAALRSLDLPSVPPSLTVVRDEVLHHEESRYTFRRAPSSSLAVTLAFDDPRIAPDASWDGTVTDFVERIASARTFAFAHEVDALVRAGQASHVDPGSVVVLAPGEVLASGAPFTADEPARHKLLDLMGDLFLYGGPPRGHVHAFRPGHRATHAILRQALAQGVVA